MLNADIGESQKLNGISVDQVLAPYIQYANIAIGGHCGDKDSILTSINICDGNNIKIGAHPSYEDRDNFGRKSLLQTHSLESINNSLKKQFDLFATIISKENKSIHHIKPHGALYTDLVHSDDLLNQFLKIAQDFFPKVKFIISPFIKKNDEQFIQEAFIDRQYHADGNLVKRSIEGAVYSHFDKVEIQLNQLIKNKKVSTREQNTIDINFQTLCIHGDNPILVKNIKKISDIIGLK